MRYVTARYKEYWRERAYRIYTTDALRAVAQNTATNEKTYFKGRYADIYNPTCVNVETRSGDDIAMEVLSKIGVDIDSELT